jgi:hypothetical protein
VPGLKSRAEQIMGLLAPRRNKAQARILSTTLSPKIFLACRMRLLESVDEKSN